MIEQSLINNNIDMEILIHEMKSDVGILKQGRSFHNYSKYCKFYTTYTTYLRFLVNNTYCYLN